MKIYYADANIFLRFILQDNPEQGSKATDYFAQAKAGATKLVFLPEIIIEIEYIIRKVYGQSRKVVVKYLSTLVKSPYIIMPNRSILFNALNLYDKISVDLVDLVLYYTAQEQNGEVLSFDEDFKKLQRLG